jgi:uncharacterized membrane protein
MMFEGLLGLVAIVALIAVAVRQNERLKLLEREIAALRSFVLATGRAPNSAAEPTPVPHAAQPALLDPVEAPAAAVAMPETIAARVEPETPVEPGPWGAERAAGPVPPAGAPPREAPREKPKVVPKKQDLETALGTRWAVWVGGVATALGAVFLIRYTIEAGLFGPAMRLSLAALLGLALIATGELLRRKGFSLPVEGAAGAYIPGVLTAAGAFTLFGTVYAAHALYGFFGPAVAFTLLGLIGMGTIGAALVHGQALAGVGLLGSMATPMLVSAQSPNAWTLFGYLAIVLAANTVVARLRTWKFLVAGGFAGMGLWTLVYLAGAPLPDMAVVVFAQAVTLAALAGLWLRTSGDDAALDWPSILPAFFVGVAALGLIADPGFAGRGDLWGAALVAAMLAIAFWRQPALPLLHGAGAVGLLAHSRFVFGNATVIEFPGGSVSVDGLPIAPSTSSTLWTAILLAALLLVAGYAAALRLVGARPLRAAAWAGWGTLVPLVSVASLWLTYGNPDRDLTYAAFAVLLVAVFVAGAELIARAERPALAGGHAVSIALAGAGVAAVLAFHMGFRDLWTTILIGAAAAVPALATRWRGYPALGWLCVGAAIVVLARAGFDPTIVGANRLGTTPFLNQLLPGYGVPALAFAFAAWQLARTTAGRPRLAMEAAAALFALLTAAMLTRHAMNGGIIDGTEPRLAEQAIYTLIALAFGGILIAIDSRSPSSVLRMGSMAMGVLSVIFVVSQHFLALNPLFTDEPTGRIPVFNLLLLAYLLPAVAAGLLAWYAHGRRPLWYSTMLGLLAAVLAFAYATFSVRRIFQGEHIGLWAGMSQMETYSYSALWLVIGVGVLVVGTLWRSQALRIASGALIALTVAKVFLFDMSELEGVLRALSFIGLGAVLIGIGLFYQRLLTRSRLADRA